MTDLEDGTTTAEIIGLEVYENDILLGTIKEILAARGNDVRVVSVKAKRDLASGAGD